MTKNLTDKSYLAIVLISLVAITRSYEPTRLEDVIAEYDFRVFKDLFVNTTKHLLRAIDSLENSTAKSDLLIDLKEAVKDMTQSLVTLSQETTSVKELVNSGADDTKQALQEFKMQMMTRLSTLQDFVEEKTKEMEGTVSRLSDMSVNILAGDCQDLYDLGSNASGVYFLQKFGRQVLCDMETDEGGWLVIQRRARVAEQVDFNRDWQEYKTGFGDLESEFWAGNDFLHILTNQKSYRLKIEMEDYEKGYYWALYSSFRVGRETTGYEMDIGDYTGNATDAFSYHHGRPFTTTDRDNDLYDDGNCATYFSGGWWYDRCYDAHLNGVFPVVPDRQNASFITWWAHEDAQKVPLVLTSVTLKLKPNTP
ncbi:fibrinogen-like protein A isoform X2 [Palaemon carinicauda]|uniref:fibrinogen-like protein A isoform X2 n=1 Tax=Palaemon carinicauda TaxID=392227 RepID=UPI0035B5F5D8